MGKGVSGSLVKTMPLVIAFVTGFMIEVAVGLGGVVGALAVITAVVAPSAAGMGVSVGCDCERFEKKIAARIMRRMTPTATGTAQRSQIGHFGEGVGWVSRATAVSKANDNI
jgi:hypothetical protein